MQNLREREIAAISKMLTISNTCIDLLQFLIFIIHQNNFQKTASLGIDYNEQWKVLIYDQECRDIISPLMNIGALRQKGVTLHMLVGIINFYCIYINCY
jgi:hypothetical protein